VAIGDALGAPFENLRPGMEGHDPRLAAGGIAEFHPYDGWPAGTWTDDTGMTMALCRGFIDHRKTNKPLEECIRDAFHSWAESPDSRRPGHTVYHAAKYGIADENSWANGALMRCAPVAIYAHLGGYEQKKAVELALSVAGLTHRHPQATLPAVECVLALRSIFSGEKVVPRDLARAWYDLPEETLADPRIKEYERLRHLPINHCHPTSGLWMWRQVFKNCLGLEEGNSWMSVPDFEEGILKAVNEIADRDTAGGVAGALLGTYWGLRGIPERWKKSVCRAEEIIEIADSLIHYAYLEPHRQKKNKKNHSDEEIARNLFEGMVGFEVKDEGIYCVECYKKKYGSVINGASCEAIYDDPREKDFRRGTSGHFIGQDEVLPCSNCKRVILNLSERENKKEESSYENRPQGKTRPSELSMSADEYLSAFLDYRKMKICSGCFRIYGLCIDRCVYESYYQKCDCAKPDMPPWEMNQEKWERFDYNQIVTLCHCCGQEILKSGSKWSVWFCEECKKRVLDFRKKHQIWVSPIGRHSLMHGVGLSAKDARNKDERIKEFLFFMDKLSAAMVHLSKWHKHNMLNNFRTLGYQKDVLLTDYLIRTQELPSKYQAFQGMAEFFGIHSDLIRGNS